jgi:hypothetical protein
LLRHGNIVFFLDLLCRATRSNLSLYMIKAQDSSSQHRRFYSCGTIAVQNDHHEESGLREALRLLRERSSREWRPSYCVTTHEATVTRAVEAALPSCKALISREARKREWERWFAASSNSGCCDQLQMFKKSVEALANASSLDDYDVSVEEAKACLADMQPPASRAYWEKNWLSRRDRFASAPCPITELSSARADRVYLCIDKDEGELLGKGDDYLHTRRMLNFDRIGQRLVRDSSDENTSCGSVSKSESEEQHPTLESLKQISAALFKIGLWEEVDLNVAKKAVGDLMAVLKKNSKCDIKIKSDEFNRKELKLN